MVQLKINSKTYKKDKPTVRDWYASLDQGNEPIRYLKDRETADQVINSIRGYIGIPDDVDILDCNIEDIAKAFQQSQKDIVEAFGKGNEVWGKNENPQEKN